MKGFWKPASWVFKTQDQGQKSRLSNSSFTAAVEQFSHMELEFEILEFHRSRFEDGEGEKEKKRRKRRSGSKEEEEEEEEEDNLEKTRSEEENLEMEDADDLERWRRSKLDLYGFEEEEDLDLDSM